MKRKGHFIAEGELDVFRMPCILGYGQKVEYHYHEIAAASELPHTVIEELHGKLFSVTFHFAPAPGYFDVGRTTRRPRKKRCQLQRRLAL